MNKLAIDNLKAHNVRQFACEMLNEIVRDSIFSFQLSNQVTKLHRGGINKLNTITNRFSVSLLEVDSVGHSLVLMNKRKPGQIRIVDFRFDNGNGVYWKGVNGEATYEAMKMINPVFIIPHIMGKSITSIAVYDLSNPYMRKSCWSKYTGDNGNRLQNTKISSNFELSPGFPVINKECPELIQQLKAYFV